MNKIPVRDVHKEIQKRKAKELLEVRKKAQKHTFYFCEEIERDKKKQFFTRDKHHVILLSMLFDLATEGVIRRFTTSMPPRGGKSYTSTFAIAKAIGDFPELSHMRNSFSASLSVKQLSHAVRTIVKSEEFRRIYPDVSVDPKADSKDRWNLKGSTRPVYNASGIGGTQSGYGCDGYLVLDDEYSSMVDASSEAMRNQTDTWIDSAHISRGEGDFKEVYICTRWTEFDRIGQIKANYKTYYIDFIKYRNMLQGEDSDEVFEEVYEKLKKELSSVENAFDVYFILDVPALIKIGENEISYCNSIFPTEYYLELREKYQKRGQLYIWDAVFMQDPSTSSKKLIVGIEEFPASLFTVIDKSETIAYIDPAYGGGDNLSMPIAVPHDGCYYIIDTVYSMKRTESTIPMIIKAIKEYHIRKIEIEGNRGGDEFAHRLREKIREYNLRCNVRIIKNQKNKLERILIRSGDIVEYVKLLHPKDHPHEDYSRFVLDVKNLDRDLQGAKDDALDSLSGLVNMKITSRGSKFRELF